jgi:hypothetical protein
MKLYKKIMSFALVLGLLATLAACSNAKKTAKAPAGEEDVNLYCHGADFETNAKAFRFSAIGSSMDMMTSKNKALSEARAGLAAQIQTKVSRVIDNYVKSAEHQNKEDLGKRYEGLSREVVKQNLEGTKSICEKMTKTKDGTYKTYICIELGGPELLGSLNSRLSKDEMLKIDYDYEKFKKTFEEEMNRADGN